MKAEKGTLVVYFELTFGICQNFGRLVRRR
jgi:hypothetical protein